MMAKPPEKLAESLEVLRKLRDRGVVAIRSVDLSRTHRQRLQKNGFLQEVMKGWYIPSRPDEARGESTAWYASFWDFCAAYLAERFGDEWALSPEQSLLLHTGNRAVPHQLLVRTPKGGNKPTKLPHDTSLFDMRSSLPDARQVQEIDGLKLFSVPAALVAAGPTFFNRNSTEARAALAMVRDPSDVLELLLDGGHSKVAGRLAGAFRNIGRDRIADNILKTMRAADYTVTETDPFADKPGLELGIRELSPYVNRMKLMWQRMSAPVLEVFPPSPGLPNDTKNYLRAVDEVYVSDAYHSLSIEGYRVNAALIERIRRGAWDPDNNQDDQEQKNVLAARGYHEAFQAVKESVRSVLQGENGGDVADRDHRGWYTKLFAPSVTAGILRTADLAGYRNSAVYIRRSKHVPPRYEAVRDMMPAFFDLLREETEPAVRVVLGHFVFVYIHPYMDGNGRIGRFLMNVMLAAGGYPWTVIPVEERDKYMTALEDASVQQDIRPFATFLGLRVQSGLDGKPAPHVPEE